jgi:hypothetical protein
VHPPDCPARSGIAGEQVKPMLLARIDDDLAGGLELGDRRFLGRDVVVVTGLDPERISVEEPESSG